MVSLIKTLEGALVGVGPATANLKQGIRDRHVFCTTESSFEFGSGLSTLTYYTTSLFDKIGKFWSLFSDHFPYIISVLGREMDKLPLHISLAYVGFVTSGFRIVKESLSLHRQRTFLSLFKRHAWQGSHIRNVLDEMVTNFDQPTFQNTLPEKFKNLITGRKQQLQELLNSIDAGDQVALQKAEEIFAHWTGRNIRDGLETIKNLSTVEFERALPIWLYNDIILKGGKDYLNALLKKVYKGDPAATTEATKLLDDMRSYARKKQIIHILRIVGAIVSGISFIGFLVAWPFALTLMFMALVSLLGLAVYMTNQGYVENRKGGFSLRNCIPVCILGIPAMIKNLPATIKSIPSMIMTMPARVEYLFKAKNSLEIPSHISPTIYRNLVRLQAAKEKRKGEQTPLYVEAEKTKRLERRRRLEARGIFLGSSAA